MVVKEYYVGFLSVVVQHMTEMEEYELDFSIVLKKRMSSIHGKVYYEKTLKIMVT